MIRLLVKCGCQLPVATLVFFIRFQIPNPITQSQMGQWANGPNNQILNGMAGGLSGTGPMPGGSKPKFHFGGVLLACFLRFCLLALVLETRFDLRQGFFQTLTWRHKCKEGYGGGEQFGLVILGWIKPKWY